MRLLIVEDDAVLADGLSRSLRACGYAVDVVDDGERADAALTAQRYDLVILDLGLPRLGGLELLQRLRARNIHSPVLVLTADDSVERLVEDHCGWVAAPERDIRQRRRPDHTRHGGARP